jgi:hypothetical protein
MANALYPSFKEAILQADIDLSAVDVKVVLVDLADYTYSSTDNFLNDVAAGGRVATSGNLASKTFTGGVFDSADPVFTGATGDQAEALILYVDSGVAATSWLIAYLDTGVTGLPVTPNSGDINITVNASGWFAL